MKIVYCIINTWYAGGLTRVLANKANYLANNGYDVTIITTDQFRKGHFYEMSDKIKFIDLNIDYVGYDQDRLLRKAKILIKKFFLHYKKLNQVLRDIKPDIVISLFYKDLFLLPFIKDGSKKILEAHSSKYTWEHTRVQNGIFGKFQNWLDNQFIKRFDRFVVLTEEDKPDWGKLKNIEVIPNANTFESNEVSSLDNKTVMASGRYGYQKNFEDLLMAWKIVHEKHPDWKLKLIGQGMHKFSTLIDELEITSSVEYRESKNIKEEFLTSSIFALSSRYEGLGMVLIEAQVCGVPLVSYACKCGPRDIIKDGYNGFLVDTGDVSNLANKIMRLIEDDNLRFNMGSNAKIDSRRFSEDTIMNRWRNLFSELVQSK